MKKGLAPGIVIPGASTTTLPQHKHKDTQMVEKTLAERQADGLRALADMVQQHPELSAHLNQGLRAMGTHIINDALPAFRDFAKAALSSGAEVKKNFIDEYSLVEASWEDGAVSCQIQAFREDVCERVVTGTQTVTKTVPDPEQLSQVPQVEVTEEVDVVEWRCRPILSGESDF